MRVAVTGITGQLGHDLVQTAKRSPMAEKLEVIALDRAALDVRRARDVRSVLETVRPTAVIHAGAYTKVDLAEGEGRLDAYAVNAFGAQHLAQACGSLGITLVYVSTDYVFDGKKRTPYTEFDVVNPINEYGRSKWAGEEFVRRHSPRHFIVRTSWVYGENTASGGGNFVKTMMRLARRQMDERPEGFAEVAVVSDQVGCPTWSRDLAEGIWNLLLANSQGLDTFGTYHMAGSGACSWHDFASAIFQEAGFADRVTVRAIPASEYPLPARRPEYSVLEPLALRVQGLPILRDWRAALSESMNVIMTSL